MNTTATTAPAATTGTEIVTETTANAETVKAPAKRTPRKPAAKTAPAAKKAAPAKKAAAPKAEPKVVATKPAKVKIDVLDVDRKKLTVVAKDQGTKPTKLHLPECAYHAPYKAADWFRKATKDELAKVTHCEECARTVAKARIATAAAKKTARKAPAKKVAATNAA